MPPNDAREHTAPFKHALDGLRYTQKNHTNLRIHLLVALTVIILGLTLNIHLVHWAILIFTITLVIICEMINTALETLGDAITLQYNQEIKIAKDVSAGMVLVSSLAAVLVGGIIFLPYIFIWFL